MIIAQDKWAEASGGYVEDARGFLWRIIGFIDRPTVILEPIHERGVPTLDPRERQYIVMGSPQSEDYHQLVRADG